MTKIDNRIEIIVGARDMTRADLDDLRRRLDDFGRKVATAKINVDDKAAQATLLRMSDQLRKLNGRVAKPEIDLQGFARAEVQLAALERSFDRLGGGPSASGGGGFFSKLGNWLNPLKNWGTMFSGFANGFMAGLAGMVASGTQGIVVLAALTAAVGALLAALAPVVAALIPITIGFGGLAFIAKTELSPVFAALTAHGKALTTALQNMSPAQRAAYREAEPLKDAFGKLMKAVQPEIMKAFDEALKILKDLMPALKPLIEAAAKAVDTFLKRMDTWLKSPSGQAFVHWLETQGPKDIATFGKIFWDTAVAVGIALDHIYRAGLWLEQHLKTFFTVDIPASFDIFKEVVRIAFDNLKLAAMEAYLSVTTTFGHLPGPLGAPFRSMSDTVRKSMANVRADMNQATDNIINDIQRIHGKTVAVNVDLGVPSQGKINAINRGYATGTSGAAPGWAWVGERGPEIVKMAGGETVIPNHVLTGYAGGAGLDFTDKFRPSVRSFLSTVNSDVSRVENAIASGVQKAFARAVPQGGGGAAMGGGAIEALARRMFPWPAYEWTDFTLVEQREAGWNMYARNPSSGAYGLAQFINGPSEYYTWGGNPNTAGGQLTAMFNYIASRYGDPLRAWGHEMTYGWYAGGTRSARPGYAVVGERGPELVGRGGIPVTLEVVPGGGGQFEQMFAEMIRRYVRVRGGNVQRVFGRT